MKRIFSVVLTSLFLVLGLAAVPAAATGGGAECVEANSRTVTQSYQEDTAVLTVNNGKTLCSPLVTTLLNWTYDNFGSQWPQTKANTDTKSLTTGSVTLSVADVCGQTDWYFGDGSDLPDRLLGPNNPFEPKFVHQIVGGSATYSHDDPASCNPPVVEVTVPNVTFVDPTCASDEVSFTTTPVEGVDYSVVGDVVPAGTVTITAVAQGGYVVVGTSEWSHTFTEALNGCEPPVVLEPTPTPTVSNPEPTVNVTPTSTPTVNSTPVVVSEPVVDELPRTGGKFAAFIIGIVLLVAGGALYFFTRR